MIMAGQRYLYIHPPKTGGSTAATVFKAYDKGKFPPIPDLPSHAGVSQVQPWLSGQMQWVCTIRSPMSWYVSYYHYFHSFNRTVRCDTLRQFLSLDDIHPKQTEAWETVACRMLRPWKAPRVLKSRMLHYHGARNDEDRRRAFEVVVEQQIPFYLWQLIHHLRMDPFSYKKGEPFFEASESIFFVDTDHLMAGLQGLFDRSVTDEIFPAVNVSAEAAKKRNSMPRLRPVADYWIDGKGKPMDCGHLLIEYHSDLLDFFAGDHAPLWSWGG